MQSVNVCFFGCSSYERVLELFIDAKQDLGEILSGTRRAALRPGRVRLGTERSGRALVAFEFMDRRSIEYPLGHIPGARDPLPSQHPFYVLLETSGSNETHDSEVSN